MLHSLELLPDEQGDLVVRRDWDLLRDAGLPSRADHRGATNAPHVTAISARAAIEPSLRALAVDLLGPLLPVECALTGLLVLGERRLVLARLVEVPDALVAAVLRLKAAATDQRFPGWLPHATLGHGLDRADVASAVELLDTAATPFRITSLRHWDPVAATADTLTD
jgi:hypothetical protein